MADREAVQESSHEAEALCQRLLESLVSLGEDCKAELLGAAVSCASGLLGALRKPSAEVFQGVWRARLMEVLREDPQLYAHAVCLLRACEEGDGLKRPFMGLLLLFALAYFGKEHVRWYLGQLKASASFWEWGKQLLPLDSWLVIPVSFGLPPSPHLASPFAAREPEARGAAPVRVVQTFSP